MPGREGGRSPFSVDGVSVEWPPWFAAVTSVRSMAMTRYLSLVVAIAVAKSEGVRIFGPDQCPT